ncbi:hypothetical protein [Photobacterium carnosum]|uniref:hypothetical protein n=1 Tax=Photobacterium carnosum TaxID=2023717 RepID=UPI001E396D2E|nr:hypothetical protein [Photobacterium carnosum]MCD9515584.1 hypothetical protein [Photobacterium carnosum]
MGKHTLLACALLAMGASVHAMRWKNPLSQAPFPLMLWSYYYCPLSPFFIFLSTPLIK